MTGKRQKEHRQRRSTVWTEEEDERLVAIAQLPPRRVADLMRRSWLACRRRLIYLRADDSRSLDSQTLRSSSAR